MSKQEFTETAFARAVLREERSKGGRSPDSFVSSLYKVLDHFLQLEWRKKNPGVCKACEKGCVACCYQLITLTLGEVAIVTSFIRKMSRKKRLSLAQRLEVSAEKWLKYQRTHPFTLHDSLRLDRDWLGVVCPFLDENRGECSIYEARPTPCRAAASSIKCGSAGAQESLFHSDVEMWANRLLHERFPAVTPLPYLATQILPQLRRKL